MKIIRTTTFQLNGNTFRVDLYSTKGGFAVYTAINGHNQDGRHFDDYDTAESTYEFLSDFGKDLMWAIPEEIKEA